MINKIIAVFFISILFSCSSKKIESTLVPVKDVDSTLSSIQTPTHNDSERTDTVVIINNDTLNKDRAIKKIIDSTIDFASILNLVPEKKNLVRILLSNNNKSNSFYIYGRYQIYGKEKKITIKKGVLNVKTNGDSLLVSAHNHSANLFPPCTLTTLNNELISVGENSYRGSIIINQKDSTFSIINYLPVEDYLRGVVPLEIGRKGEEDSAAVKAQAVAARTYTYKRIEERSNWDFDLYSSVSDQVYGGVSAEFINSDRAIESTKNEVLFYNGELIDALYHSTCGGETATKSEVWGGVDIPYLQSVPDTMVDGKAFCSISPLIKWKESWTVGELSRIIAENSQKMDTQQNFYGTINNIIINSTTESGRVKELTVIGDSVTARYNGDKIRFVFRRKNGQILRSSKFKVVKSGNQIIFYGSGYGHGIGLCQMGAIGRSRLGQDYLTILQSYYTNVKIGDINEFNRRKEYSRE